MVWLVLMEVLPSSLCGVLGVEVGCMQSSAASLPRFHRNTEPHFVTLSLTVITRFHLSYALLLLPLHQLDHYSH